MNSSLENQETADLQILQVERRGIAPGTVILNYADQEDVDLIVMGTHGRRGLGHLFLGSVAEEIVRRARCPVLTVREQKEPQKIEALEHILVPLDFSEHSRNALAYAKNIAAAYAARLHLLHVVEGSIHPYFYSLGKSSILDLYPEVEPRSRQELEKMFREVEGPEVEMELHVIAGRANSDILKFAEKKASDLIVIATHGLTGIEHFFIGSTTQKVVRRALCPVFTVKSFGKSLL